MVEIVKTQSIWKKPQVERNCCTKVTPEQNSPHLYHPWPKKLFVTSPPTLHSLSPSFIKSEADLKTYDLLYDSIAYSTIFCYQFVGLCLKNVIEIKLFLFFATTLSSSPHKMLNTCGRVSEVRWHEPYIIDSAKTMRWWT
jgi:hypothetical protein